MKIEMLRIISHASICLLGGMALAQEKPAVPQPAVPAGKGPPAVKLFQTDFGGTMRLGRPEVYNNSRHPNGWWPILGEDCGYSWPISIYGGSSKGLKPISYGPAIEYDPEQQVINANGKPCWKADIIQGTRHDGSTGPVFHQVNYQNILWQFPYTIEPGRDVADQYEKIWMKFPANLAQQLGRKGWRSFAGWKDTGYNIGGCPHPGYRIELFVMTDEEGKLFWDAHGDNCAQGPHFWDQKSRAPIPVGEWFCLEWAWHRTHDASSFTWIKVNGKQILTQNGGGTNPTGFYAPGGPNRPIDRIFLFLMYGRFGPSEQWFDHVEIWDGVPAGSATPVPGV